MIPEPAQAKLLAPFSVSRFVGLLAVRLFNLHGDELDAAVKRSGWRMKEASVGERIGAELIGGSVYELEAGDRLWPYDAHHANEAAHCA